jgi:hypothetical protein
VGELRESRPRRTTNGWTWTANHRLVLVSAGRMRTATGPVIQMSNQTNSEHQDMNWPPGKFIARNRYKLSRSDQFFPNFIESTLVLEFAASVDLQLREYVREMELHRALLDIQDCRNFLV